MPIATNRGAGSAAHAQRLGAIITTASKRIAVRAGSTIHLTQPVDLPTGSYFLRIDLDPTDQFNDRNPSNKLFTTTSLVTVS